MTINVVNFTGTGNLVLATSPTLVTPILGAATATSLTASGTVTAATLNSTTLNASQAVFTDASKNLVSVATNGSGSVVLTTSPTLVTPILGAATATSLTASGTVTAATLNSTTLTASQAVFTDASNNLVSVATNGSGSVVLTTSPTLVTPDLGAATATSLSASGTVSAATLRGTSLTASGVVLTDGSSNLTVPANGANGTVLSIVAGVPAWAAITSLGAVTATSLTASGTVTAATLNSTTLTASQAVFTDASKNLVSVATNGTGSVVLTTSPTLVTPNIGFATATGLVVTGGSSTDIGINLNTVVANRRISFAGSNEFEYTGFGLATTALKYSVANSSADHIFYCGLTSSTETELFRVKGGGGARAPYAADAITVGTPPSSLAQIAISGTGSARYHLYNGGGVVEWIFGQNSSSSHDFTFSTVVSGTPTTRATLSKTGEFYATPKYGIRYMGSSQLITAALDVDVIWATQVAGPLTLTTTTFTNNTSNAVVVQVSYSLHWDAFFGGTITTSWVNVGSLKLGYCNYTVGANGGNAVNTATFTLAVGSSFSIQVRVPLTNLTLFGGTYGNNSVSEMSYYILN